MIACTWLDSERQAVRIAIGGRMTIDRAGELHEAIRAVFPEASRICYDLSGVDELDVAGLQLLFSSEQSARFHGKELQITGLKREPLQTVMKAAGSLRPFTCQQD